MAASGMKAVLLKAFGGAEQMYDKQTPRKHILCFLNNLNLLFWVLDKGKCRHTIISYIGDASKPKVPESNILVRVKAAGLNRADIQQRRGKYPAPPGESEIMGLEVAGVVEEVGSEVTRWKKGDEVMALLGGGGYAQYVSVHAGHAMRIPKGYSMIQAAGVMETYMTTFQSLFWLGKISKGESVLIHGGASGIGTSAIQLAKSLPGVRVFATAGSDEKCKTCESLGAEKCINYKTTPDFVSEILSATKDEPRGAGVDFILDFVGQQYFNQNLNLLKTDGRLVYLAMLSGPIAEKVDMGPILRKRLSIQGTTLRSRSIEYKSRLVKDFEAYGTELLDEGILKPIIDKTFDWAEIAEAHNYMEQNMNSGKIILTGM